MGGACCGAQPEYSFKARAENPTDGKVGSEQDLSVKAGSKKEPLTVGALYDVLKAALQASCDEPEMHITAPSVVLSVTKDKGKPVADFVQPQKQHGDPYELLLVCAAARRKREEERREAERKLKEKHTKERSEVEASEEGSRVPVAQAQDAASALLQREVDECNGRAVVCANRFDECTDMVSEFHGVVLQQHQNSESSGRDTVKDFEQTEFFAVETREAEERSRLRSVELFEGAMRVGAEEIAERSQRAEDLAKQHKEYQDVVRCQIEWATGKCAVKEEEAAVRLHTDADMFLHVSAEPLAYEYAQRALEFSESSFGTMGVLTKTFLASVARLRKQEKESVADLNRRLMRARRLLVSQVLSGAGGGRPTALDTDLVVSQTRPMCKLSQATVRRMYGSAMRVYVRLLMYERKWRQRFGARRIAAYARFVQSSWIVHRLALRQLQTRVYAETANRAMSRAIDSSDGRPPNTEEISRLVREAIASDPLCKQLRAALRKTPNPAAAVAESRRRKLAECDLSQEERKMLEEEIECEQKREVKYEVCEDEELSQKEWAEEQREERARAVREQLTEEDKEVLEQMALLPSKTINVMWSRRIASRFGAIRYVRRYCSRWGTVFRTRRTKRHDSAVTVQSFYRGYQGRMRAQRQAATAAEAKRVFGGKRSELYISMDDVRGGVAQEEHATFVAASVWSEEILTAMALRRDMCIAESRRRAVVCNDWSASLRDLQRRDGIARSALEASAMCKSIAARQLQVSEKAAQAAQARQDATVLCDMLTEEARRDSLAYSRRLTHLFDGANKVNAAVGRASVAMAQSEHRRRSTAAALVDGDILTPMSTSTAGPRSTRGPRRSFAAANTQPLNDTVMESTPRSGASPRRVSISPQKAQSPSVAAVARVGIEEDDAALLYCFRSMGMREVRLWLHNRQPESVDGGLGGIAAQCRAGSSMSAWSDGGVCLLSIHSRGVLTVLARDAETSGSSQVKPGTRWQKVCCEQWSVLWTHVSCYTAPTDTESSPTVHVAYYAGETGELGVAAFSSEYLAVTEKARTEVAAGCDEVSHAKLTGSDYLLLAQTSTGSAMCVRHAGPTLQEIVPMGPIPVRPGDSRSFESVKLGSRSGLSGPMREELLVLCCSAQGLLICTLNPFRKELTPSVVWSVPCVRACVLPTAPPPTAQAPGGAAVVCLSHTSGALTAHHLPPDGLPARVEAAAETPPQPVLDITLPGVLFVCTQQPRPRAAGSGAAATRRQRRSVVDLKDQRRSFGEQHDAEGDDGLEFAATASAAFQSMKKKKVTGLSTPLPARVQAREDRGNDDEDEEEDPDEPSEQDRGDPLEQPFFSFAPGSLAKASAERTASLPPLRRQTRSVVHPSESLPSERLSAELPPPAGVVAVQQQQQEESGLMPVPAGARGALVESGLLSAARQRAMGRLQLGRFKLAAEGRRDFTDSVKEVCENNSRIDHRGKGLNDAAAMPFVTAVATSRVMTTLLLDDNALQDDFAIVLSTTLRYAVTLTQLGLSSNHITDSGARHLKVAAELNQCLRRLDLTNNPVSPPLLRQINDMMRVRT